jgi:hypothetical protein
MAWLQSLNGVEPELYGQLEHFKLSLTSRPQ